MYADAPKKHLQEKALFRVWINPGTSAMVLAVRVALKRLREGGSSVAWTSTSIARRKKLSKKRRAVKEVHQRWQKKSP